MNHRKTLNALLALGITLAAASGSAQTPRFESLFSHRAHVDAPRGELVRVPLPAEALSVCRDDLGDIRILNDGQPVAFAIDAGSRDVAPVYRTATVIDMRQRRTRRGAEFIVEERIDIAMLPRRENERLALELRVPSGAREFVRDVRIEALPVARPPQLVTETSIYRLPNPDRERLLLPLEVDGDITTLRLTIVGPGEALNPVVRTVRTPRARGVQRLSVPITADTTTPGEGYTDVRVALSGAVRPSALLIETSQRTFHRRITVYDEEGSGDGRVIGEANVFRFDGPEGAQLSVPIRRARGRTLRVRIHDLDAAPLPQLAITAELLGPELVFDAPYGNTTVYFGALWVATPEYSLEQALLSRLARTSGDDVQEGTLRSVEQNPDHDASPPMAVAQRPGRVVDIGGYSTAAPLAVPASETGLLRVSLHPSVLAVAQDGMRDVRIVDTENRQYPYLLGDTGPLVEVPARVERVSNGDDGSTRYRIVAPYEGLPLESVTLRIDGAIFDRRAELHHVATQPDAQDPGSIITTTRLTRTPAREGDPELRVDQRPRAMELVVHDGNEQPLNITGATLRMRPQQLYLAAPAGAYRVVVGNERENYPSYDIEQARDLALSLTPTDIASGEAIPNTDYAPPRAYGEQTDWLLWAVIILAVVVLLGLTFRLVTTESDEPAEPNPGATPDEGAAEQADTAETEDAAESGEGVEATPPDGGGDPGEA